MAPLFMAFLLLFIADLASAQNIAKPLPPAPPASTPSTGPGDYVAGPHDVLNVTVYDEPNLSGRFRVDSDGTFPFQFIGRVTADGLTVVQIEGAMEKALGDGYLRNPQISVEVAEYRSQNVFVQGQVRSPGKYPLPANASLMDAIFLAGSTAAEAGNWVEIYHQGVTPGPSTANVGTRKPDIRVRLADVQSGKAQTVRIQDGDTIFVPKAERIYVTGQVRNPGAYAYDDDMTVFTAISMAGGITEKGSNSRVSITRLVKGRRTEIDAKQEDKLQPGDQVTVKPRRL